VKWLCSSLAVLAVLTAGCGAAPSAPRSNARAAQTTHPPPPSPAPPPVSPEPTVPPRPDGGHLSACRPAQLRGRAADKDGLTGGTMTELVTVRNVSNQSCSLVGEPAVTAYGPTGRPLRLRHVWLDGFFTRHRKPVALLAHPRYRRWSMAWVPISLSGLTDALEPCPSGEDQYIDTFYIAIGSGHVAAPVSRHTTVGTCDGRIRTGWFLPAGGQ
jgi:hypothetical protein